VQPEGVGERPAKDAAHAEVHRTDERPDEQGAGREPGRTDQPDRRAAFH